jgi:hypothetical protein
MTLPVPLNLSPGQFQLGELVMGEWTPFSVEKMDIANYQLNVQDYQVQGTNDLKFGQDTLKPMPLTLTINVRVNKLHVGIAALTRETRTLDFNQDPNLSDLQREWRAPETLMNWNVLKPLLFCGGDGITRQFFGRPGKFSYVRQFIVDSQYYVCTAEFRRSDTFGYNAIETYVDFVPDVPQTVLGTQGNAASWTRWLIYGPANFPIINFGSKQFQLSYNILAGDVVEVSSLPWERRVINLAGQSLSPYLVSQDNLYLDDESWKIANNADTLISWNATGVDGNSKLILLWRDAYQVME